MVADASADDGERVVLLDQLEGFLEFAFGDQRHISLNADMRRAVGLTGRSAQFVDREAAGNGLREVPIDGLSFA